jgi:hypothetical protein
MDSKFDYEFVIRKLRASAWAPAGGEDGDVYFLKLEGNTLKESSFIKGKQEDPKPVIDNVKENTSAVCLAWKKDNNHCEV